MPAVVFPRSVRGKCQKLELRKTFGAGVWLAEQDSWRDGCEKHLTGQCRRTIFESRSDDERRFVERKAKCVGIRM
jgi:hypothetical protein